MPRRCPLDSGQTPKAKEALKLGRVISIPSKSPISSFKESLGQFLWFKRASGLRDSTIGDYERFAQQFFKRYPSCWPDQRRLRSSSIAYLGDKIKPSTYNLRLTYLKGFFQWCVDEGAPCRRRAFPSQKRRRGQNGVGVTRGHFPC